MTEQVKRFEVQGSSSEPYTVTFTLEGNNFNAFCTCPAGKKGQYCKHRFSLMESEPEIKGWIQGSDVEEALSMLAEAEHELARIKKCVSAAKKAVAVAMRT
jgi:uncharacterized Zn finger protein